MRRTGTPLVSVAMCTYNGQEFLSAQLGTIISQDYENLEIIIVDDCSADVTWDVLQRFAEMDRRVKLYRNKRNIGYIRNFERAIKLCKGELIALADQDDIWEPTKISEMVEAIGDNIMVYHDSDFIDENSQRIGDETMSSKFRMYEGQSCIPFIVANCISGHATLFKRKLIKYIFPFASDNYHDWWISYVAFNVGTVKYLNKILVHYRQHRNSVTDSLELRHTAPPKKTKADRLGIDLTWLSNCARYRYNKDSHLISAACDVLVNLKEGKNKFKSLVFLVKYFDLVFYFSKRKQRSFLSKVNYIRKLCYN